MPLIKSGSKKALQKNIETEMRANPEPSKRAQNLAIAYSVKRKNARKKMAKGGMAYKNDSAVTEQRPMPEERDNDAHEVKLSDHMQSLKNSDWTGRPTVEQAQRPSKTILKHPKMVPQNVYSVRLRDEEDDLQDSAGVNEGPQHQPPEHDNEEGADRQGPKVRDEQREHSNGRKPYAAGGKVIDEDAMDMHERSDEAHMQSMLDPSEDEGDEYAIRHDEMGQKRQGPKVMDMEDEHSTGRKPYAGGGRIGDFHEDMDMELNPAHDKHSADDSEMQPMDEEEMEHEDSIAASIMARKERQMRLDSDSDDDQMVMMAEGGEILDHKNSASIKSHGSMETHEDDDQADLSRNADEDANEEDQASYDALRKENYSESEGLRQLDSPMDSNQHGDDEESISENKHDRVSRIMSKMNRNRQFKQR